ncbi:unnamed protein product [Amoebophrya sp. A120]|nr:unnamed protein product [Amoebophrya sp. A120]|eukprot:GSA120T00016453001.1
MSTQKKEEDFSPRHWSSPAQSDGGVVHHPSTSTAPNSTSSSAETSAAQLPSGTSFRVTAASERNYAPTEGVPPKPRFFRLFLWKGKNATTSARTGDGTSSSCGSPEQERENLYNNSGEIVDHAKNTSIPSISEEAGQNSLERELLHRNSFATEDQEEGKKSGNRTTGRVLSDATTRSAAATPPPRAGSVVVHAGPTSPLLSSCCNLVIHWALMLLIAGLSSLVVYRKVVYCFLVLLNRNTSKDGDSKVALDDADLFFSSFPSIPHLQYEVVILIVPAMVVCAYWNWFSKELVRYQ